MPIFGCASDEQFRDELLEEIYERPESECDYCNSALRDCSLCHVTSFENFDDDTPIC